MFVTYCDPKRGHFLNFPPQKTPICHSLIRYYPFRGNLYYILHLDIFIIVDNMKRTSRQVTSKSGTPTKSKPKRAKYDSAQITKKIQKWRSAASIPTKTKGSQPQASEFINKLWKNVNKADPEAVRKVLELHASGKNGHDDAIYFSSSRFWHIYRVLKNEYLSYFLLSLWSVRLEAVYCSGDCIIIGDENCSLINHQNTNVKAVAKLLSHWDTISLAQWYETYYNLAFGSISLTDSSEINRNVAASFNGSQPSEEILFMERYPSDNVSIEVQLPDDTDHNLEQNVQELYNQLDRIRPNFLYADKSEIENSHISDRVIVVLNVMSDVDYIPPLGWSFRPFNNTPSICIPLTIFENLGVYDQISLAQEFLTFKGDNLTQKADMAVDTSDLINLRSMPIQTDPTLTIDPELISPPLTFDRSFRPLRHYPRHGHICRCMACNAFLYEFIQEWGLDRGLITDPYDNNEDNKIESIEKARKQYHRTVIDFNSNISGGNYNYQCSSSHAITEARVARRNVDLDRLSQSSPEIESSSTTSSSDSAQQEIAPEIMIEVPPKVPAQSPIIIIDEDDVPTIVSYKPSTAPKSPHIIIMDDEGTQPIVNLASSPIIRAQIPREVKVGMDKDSSSYFTSPQATQPTDDFIKQIYFDNLGVNLERINLDLILQRTTWGQAHDVLEAARVGQHHRIPTAQAAAAVLRILPIIGTRAAGGELDAVNAVGLIKSRLDEFLLPTRVESSSAPSAVTSTSVPHSSRSSKSRSYKSKSKSPPSSPAPTKTPDTPSYHPPITDRPPIPATVAYDRASRYVAAQRGGYNRRRLPRMSGPTTHIGGWHFPAEAAAAPPYVADYRYIPGWTPGMPRPPLPWERDPSQNRIGRGQQQFTFRPQINPRQRVQQPRQHAPFIFGRGASYLGQ